MPFPVWESLKYVLLTARRESVTMLLKAPFIRPASADVEINHTGVAQPGFVFTRNPDDKWKVTESGKYRITFNLKNWTIEAKSID